MAKIFISYSWDSKDHRGWIRQLSQLLESAGHTVWFDHRNLGSGQDSLRFMREGVRTADFVIPICTPNYVRRFEQKLGGVGVEAKAIEDRWKGSPQRTNESFRFFEVDRKEASLYSRVCSRELLRLIYETT